MDAQHLMPVVPVNAGDLTHMEVAIVLAYRTMSDANAKMFFGLGMDLAAKSDKAPTLRLANKPLRLREVSDV